MTFDTISQLNTQYSRGGISIPPFPRNGRLQIEICHDVLDSRGQYTLSALWVVVFHLPSPWIGRLQIEIGHDVLYGGEQNTLGALGVVEVLQQLGDGHVGRGLGLTPHRLHVLYCVGADVVQEGHDDGLRLLTRGGLHPRELDLYQGR